MARLIDADVLVQKIETYLPTFSINPSKIIELVENAPTVERPHGEWEWVTEDKYRCTNCGEVISVKEVMNVPQYITCPMCDADMRKEGDKND